MQVDTIKPTLQAPGTKRLKLKYVSLLSNFAFNFNMRRYIKDPEAKAASEAARREKLDSSNDEQATAAAAAAAVAAAEEAEEAAMATGGGLAGRGARGSHPAHPCPPAYLSHPGRSSIALRGSPRGRILKCGWVVSPGRSCGACFGVERFWVAGPTAEAAAAATAAAAEAAVAVAEAASAEAVAEAAEAAATAEAAASVAGWVAMAWAAAVACRAFPGRALPRLAQAGQPALGSVQGAACPSCARARRWPRKSASAPASWWVLGYDARHVMGSHMTQETRVYDVVHEG